MQTLKNWFQLIRWKNILFLGILLALIYFCVITPILSQYGLSIPQTGLLFTLILFSTLCIAASGYIINDYFDTKIDEINRPLKVIVGHSVTRQEAAIGFQSLMGIGIATGIGVAFWVQSVTVGLIYLVSSGLLWFYSSSYKRQFLIGNLTIALCAFLSVFLPGMIVVSLLEEEFGELIYYTTIIPEIYSWTAGFGLFAFLYTLIREIAKDAEDIEGDKELECRTLPIVWGNKGTKITLEILCLLALGLCAGFAFEWIDFNKDTLTLKYFILGILLPTAILMAWIFKAKKRSDWHQISQFIKFIMAVGSLYAGIVAYLFYINSVLQ